MDLDLDDGNPAMWQCGNVAMWHYNRCADAIKNLRKSERHVKELQFQQDEVQPSKPLLDDTMIDNDPLQDRKNHESMQGLIESLQQKIKTYKKQIEEAEEIAALNLAKFRQVGPTESFSIFFLN